MSAEQDELCDLAANIFTALVGEGSSRFFADEEEIRSAAHSDTVDVKIGDQWYRIAASKIDEPISVVQHRNGIA